MLRILSLLRSTKGQSLTEFALILPFLLLLIGAVIDFGLAFFVSQMIENAARDGARVAATIRGTGSPPAFPAGEATTGGVTCTVPSCTGSVVLTAAQAALPGSNLFNGFLIKSTFIPSVSGDVTNSDAAIRVEVQGNFPLAIIGGFLNAALPLIGGNSFDGNMNLNRSATMRWEWQN
jgi:Flp pilus assembly protein TadG